MIPKTLEQFLALNKNALEHVTGKTVVEYSAPDGNQPEWVYALAGIARLCRLLLHR